jgi:protease-4
MRKHPVILGLLLLLLVGVIFFLVVYFLGSLTGKRSLSLGDHVGVVTVEGVLRDSQDIVRQVEEFSRDEVIKAVVVRIDSPGAARKCQTYESAHQSHLQSQQRYRNL